MKQTVSAQTRRRLDIQGLETVGDQELAAVAPWLRMAFVLCASLGAVGTLMASPSVLLALALIAVIAAMSPVHPFDLIYNYGIRRVTGTGPLPRRGMPSRFGCGMGAALLVVTAWAFSAGYPVVAYALGGIVTLTALLVGTTDICIPSMMYRAMFGWPRLRETQEEATVKA